MNLEKIEHLLAGEPLYRLKQIEKSLYKDLIDSWKDVTVLPTELREKLEKEIPVTFDFETAASLNSTSIKVIMRLPDGLNVESVLMKHKVGRNTVCVSSQIGCPLNCMFCRTGKIGYIRNLNHYEIIEQVLFFSHYLNKASSIVKKDKSLKARETVKN